MASCNFINGWLGHGFISLQFISNKSAPYLVRLPNRMQVAFCFWNCDPLKQYAIKKYKCRNTHIGGAMDKHRAVIKSLHDSTESPEILWRGSFEIHRDMDVRHAQ